MWKKLDGFWVAGEGQYLCRKKFTRFWLFRGLIAGRRGGWLLFQSSRKGWKCLAEWANWGGQAPVWLDPSMPIAHNLVRKAQNRSWEFELCLGMHVYKANGITYFNNPFQETIRQTAVILEDGTLGVEMRDEEGRIVAVEPVKA